MNRPRPRPWKRTLLMLLLLLTGGAIINVAVAWGLVAPLFWKPWFGYGKGVDSGFFHYDGWEWHFEATQHAGLQETIVRPLRTRFMMKPEETRPPIWVVIPIWNENREVNMLYRIDAGWPSYSLQYALGYRGDWNKVYGLAIRGGLRLSRSYQEPAIAFTPGQFGALPFIPRWPGFAINTIFYAAILWPIFAFPFALRRRRRIKRGLCPACAYPVGVSPVCTECGKPVIPYPTPSPSGGGRGPG